jgi:hypothetical protein
MPFLTAYKNTGSSSFAAVTKEEHENNPANTLAFTCQIFLLQKLKSTQKVQ